MKFCLIYITVWLVAIQYVSPSGYCITDGVHQRDPSCTKLCNCQDRSKCNNPRSCPCQKGWMGDYCQYANIARPNNYRTVKSGTYTISLNITYPVSVLRIILRNPRQFSTNYFTISVSNQNGRPEVCCRQCILTRVGDVFCEYPIIGNKVIINGRYISNIYTVQVFGGKNIALWKEASQNSNWNSKFTNAGRAVDGYIGDREIHPPSGPSCTHTLPGRHLSWSVSFPSIYDISWIRIYNRAELKERLKFQLSFFEGNNTTTIYENYSGNIGDSLVIDIQNSPLLPRITNKLIVTKNSTIAGYNGDNVLTLCEVQAYACRPIKNGSEICTHFCSDNCISEKFCEGTRCKLCKPGFHGERCVANTSPLEIYCTQKQRSDACALGYCKSCTRLCHCRGDKECNRSTGVCPDGCESKWMGNNCQYENLAWQNYSRLYDGYAETCQTNPTLGELVILNSTYPIAAIRLILKENTNVIFSVQVSKDGRHWMTCQANYTVSRIVNDMICTKITRGNQIRINSTNAINFCEIQIYGGRNVALWQTASQVSTYENGYSYSADLAVDGIETFNFSRKPPSCQHTNYAAHPWWNVLLDKYYSVTRIKLYLRGDQNINRMRNFELIIGNNLNHRNVIFRRQSSMNPDQLMEIQRNLPQRMTHLKISILDGAKQTVLHVCEVEVYACFPTSNDGENCDSFCPENCLETEKCINANFSCPDCKDGWKGEYCDQKITCSTVIDSNAIINMNKTSYDYGEVLRITCKPGYKLKGNSSITCTGNGTWYRQGPYCQKITCSTVIDSNAILNMNKTSYEYGEVVTITCKPGYKLDGSSSINCIGNGTWNRQGPYCQRKPCPDINASNADVTSQNQRNGNFVYGDIINVHCQDGYRIIKQSTITCTQNGVWDNDGPFCEKKQCPDINVSNADINGSKTTDFVYEDVVRLACHQGYNITHQSTITCTKNGDWDYKGPYCERVSCPIFNTSHVNISNNNIKRFVYEDSVTLSCEEGYRLLDTSKIQCDYNGQWNDEGPYCHIITCIDPIHHDSNLLLKHSTNTSPIFEYSNVVTLACDRNYDIVGEDTAICTDNGEWSVNLPICNAKSSSEASPIGAIAGGTSGTIIVFIILIIVVIIFLRRRNTSRKGEEARIEDSNTYAMVDKSKRLRKNENTEYNKIHNGEQKEESTPYYNMKSVDQQQAKVSRNDVYYDFTVPNKPSTNAVHVSAFKEQVEEMKHNTVKIKNEFSKLKSGLQLPTEAALRPTNTVKNKYRNIYPYDETRVKLSNTGLPDSDYINACHIHGFGKVNSYIASQGPLKETLDDFWRMVWQENARKIVMLTNLLEERKVKCIQYWPEDKEELQCGEMNIKIIDIEQYADFVIRVLSLKNSEGSRTVKQFHFTAWPDKGVPSYASSLVHFRTKVMNTPMPGAGPIVVHCSAGIGRTGTFIALDYLAKQAKETDYIDVFGCVETLRRQRVNMVQTQEQYMFVHDALLETLMCPTSATSTKDFLHVYSELLEIDPMSNKKKLQLEFETLNSTSPVVPNNEFSKGKNSTCRKKNRYSNILPVDSARPFLPATSTDNQYINAVYLPAYREKNAFIVTQMPLKETIADFWRLIDDKDVSTVVMLNTLENLDDQNIGEYWHEDGKTTNFEEYEIAVQNTVTDADGDFEVVNLAYNCQGRKKHVRVFKTLFWPDDCNFPTLVRALLKLIETADMHRKRQRSGPMVVHCMNGCDKSGLFCVLHVVLERLKLEQDVGIQQIIKQMRSIRPQIIPNFEQFQFCHEVVLEFMKQYDDYSNFQ